MVLEAAPDFLTPDRCGDIELLSDGGFENPGGGATVFKSDKVLPELVLSLRKT